MATEKHLVNQSDTVGNPPSGFIIGPTGAATATNWRIAEFEGAKVIQVDENSNFHQILPVTSLLLPTATGQPIAEIIARLHVISSSGGQVNESIYGATLHARNELATDSTTRSYYAGAEYDSSTRRVELIKSTGNTGGSFLAVTTSAVPVFNGNWVFVAMRRNSDLVEAQAWLEGDARPGTWPLSASDTQRIDRPRWGFGAQNAAIYYSGVSIGTNGDPAPLPVADSAARRRNPLLLMDY